MFSGLSAFPLTPMNEDRIDEAAFVGLIERLTSAGVDSIGALGSTGSYAYLTREERARVAKIAVEHAGNTPVIVGIGALRTRDVLNLADDAQKAGVSGLLLAPMSYQKLSDEEVFQHFKAVSAVISVPLCVYDNPGTTHFHFSDELHGRIAELPHVASIKIPGVPNGPQEAKARVERLRAQIPSHVSIGVSGDAFAATGLSAGCDVWYSVIAGLFPNTALELTRAAQSGNHALAQQLSSRLQDLWDMFGRHNGSLRCIAAGTEILNLVDSPCLPLPLVSVQGEDRTRLARLIEQLELS
ncbi:dihydrodipicolinate synthase family protein [Vibrio fluvialis]|uniref:dihydrodipicolinate synthase family protein n=1 Tax=Vibrio fluvialis TaxID=676 RepID=UPI001EEB3780|nr:dihydrodipicolinate synthase family protein [Vibrio fluvialis]ELX7500649.1 dihydrodipicolinate synthase family protein [Vibrio fluvialis]MCG6343877.1 dihydrodipicolinate synthase family protein [Vibrio fluvialis]